MKNTQFPTVLFGVVTTPWAVTIWVLIGAAVDYYYHEENPFDDAPTENPALDQS